MVPVNMHTCSPALSEILALCDCVFICQLPNKKNDLVGSLIWR